MAKILHSVTEWGDELITFQEKFPRFILPEVNTHRAFSRNLSSSRAIPTAKIIKQVIDDPAIPIHWGKNKSGMQATEEIASCEAIWLHARDNAVRAAEEMASEGLHKQVVNRVLEPFMKVTAVISVTLEGLINFMNLRDHKDAQPEIQAMARGMRDEWEAGGKQELSEGEWHIPYLTCSELESPLEERLMLSAARCASVSFNSISDGKLIDIDNANRIWKKLITSKPAHASPVEHQARAAFWGERSRNFVGFIQHREILGL